MKRNKFLALLLAMVLLCGLLPVSAFADAGDNHANQVHVIVENTTYSKDDGAPWDGTLIDTWVDLAKDSTMMNCVVAALSAKGYTQSGAESNYISSINGLAASDGGSASGWMGTLNDWFTNKGVGDYTVAAGTLIAGDEIRIMYSRSYGEDLGGSWGNNNKTLSALAFSAGTLSTAFSPDTHAYTLTVPASTTGVVVTPTAANKNFQVRTKVGNTTYQRTTTVPVTDGTVISVTCGDPTWPTMNDAASVQAETYTVTVREAAPAQGTPVTAQVTASFQQEGTFWLTPHTLSVSSDLAESYGYPDQVTGQVSALDVLVKALEIVYEDDFSAETKDTYLTVAASGMVTVLGSNAFGFAVNGEYPVDLTSKYGEYGYTGYAISQAPIENNDSLEFFFYQDTSSGDQYTWFEQENSRIDTTTATAGEAFSLTLKGYTYAYDGSKKLADRTSLGAIKNADLYLCDPEYGVMGVDPIGTTDDNGTASIRLDEQGTYYITAVSSTGQYIVSPWLTVTVKASAAGHPVKLRMMSKDASGTASIASGYTCTVTDQSGHAVELGNSTEEGRFICYTPTLQNGVYTLSVKDGTTNLGSCTFTVSDTNTATSQPISFLKVRFTSNEGFVAGTDYTLKAVGSSDSGFTATPAPQADGSYSLVLTMVQHDLTVTPSSNKQALGYAQATAAGKMLYSATGSLSCTYSAPSTDKDSITVPTGATLWVGVMPTGKWYKAFETVAPTGDKTTSAEQDTYTFQFTKGTTYCYRVSQAGKLTVTDKFTRGSDAASVQVTAAQMSNSPTAVARADGYYESGLLTNAGSTGEIQLAVGDSFDVLALRNWQIVNDSSNNYTVSPDFHYQVISGSDVASIDEAGKITANDAGTALIAVTYDAISAFGHIYGAIYPENTGILVVKVGGESVYTGITLDSEFDVLYYTDAQDGYRYTFTPETGSTVSVLRPTVLETGASYGSGTFSTKNVVKAKDGAVTALLTQGRNVIKVTKGGNSSYQVLTVKQLTVAMHNNTQNNEVTPQTPAAQGDSITVTYSGLSAALGKLACLYNFQNRLKITGEDAAQIGEGWTPLTFGGADYTFTTQHNSFTFTIPDNWTGATYSLTGTVNSSGYGEDAGAHRRINTAIGVSSNLSAQSQSFDYSSLPTLSVPVKRIPYTAQIVTTPSNAVVALYDAAGTLLTPQSGLYTLSKGDRYSYTVSCPGYISRTGTITGVSALTDGRLMVDLVKAPGSPLSEVDAAWKNFRNSDVNMAITNATTPIVKDDTALLWSKKLGSGWSAAPSVQIIVDNALIVMSGSNLYKLDLSTGEVLATAAMAAAPNFGYTPPVYAEGMIFCPLTNGTVQAFNAKTLESLWVYTDSLKGQSLSPITYADGYLYTGFWNGETQDANFVCLSVTDENPAQTNEAKTAVWKQAHAGGFYWAGSVIVGNAVLVGTDDGTSGSAGTSHLYSYDKLTGKLLSSLDLTGMGDQRSSLAYVADTGRVYFTTKGGYLCWAQINAQTGEFGELCSVNYHAQSTSTPVVYGGKVYFATGSGISSSGSSGNFVCADASDLHMLFSIGLKGYPQCSLLLSTAYEQTGYLYFYSTYNAKPGGISMLKVTVDADSADDAELIELYDAADFPAYCVTSIICGTDGTLYYKNDAGSVLCVGVPKATQVFNLIAAIGTVTRESGTAISTARNAYNALSAEDQSKVTNYALLTAAEKAYQSACEAYDADCAAQVAGQIAAIGTVTLGSKASVQSARSAYEALTDTQKALVGNYSVLVLAEQALLKLVSTSQPAEKPSQPLAQPGKQPSVTTTNELAAGDKVETIIPPETPLESLENDTLAETASQTSLTWLWITLVAVGAAAIGAMLLVGKKKLK
jgi:hypothetical protein